MQDEYQPSHDTRGRSRACRILAWAVYLLTLISGGGERNHNNDAVGFLLQVSFYRFHFG